MQYLALIHTNTESTPPAEEWEAFFKVAKERGMFLGGSAVGVRRWVGPKRVSDATESIGGFMRFDAECIEDLVELLETHHPVVRHGGSVELCEMPNT